MKKTSLIIVLIIIILALIYLLLSSNFKPEPEEVINSQVEITESGFETLPPTPPTPPTPSTPPTLQPLPTPPTPPTPPVPPAPVYELIPDPSEPTWKTPAGQEGSESFWIQ